MIDLVDAKPSDLKEVMDMVRTAHKNSPFGDRELDELQVRRAFTVAASTPAYYARLVKKGDSVVGVLCGIVQVNVQGVKVAADLLNFSRFGTDRLIKDFFDWAKSVGADYVQIVDLTKNQRYARLLSNLDMNDCGVVYLKAV